MPDDPASAEDLQGRAREICLRLLTLAPRTRAQLADALRRRGIPGDVAEGVLGRFTDVGLIDDAAFAKAWVESRHYSRGLAGRALKAELRRQGIDDGQAREAVAGLDPDAEVATARQLVERKLAGTKGQPPQARARRLAGMLARKGYPPGLAYRVIREAMEAEGTGAVLDGEASFGDFTPQDPLPHAAQQVRPDVIPPSADGDITRAAPVIFCDRESHLSTFPQFEWLRKVKFGSRDDSLLAQTVINA